MTAWMRLLDWLVVAGYLLWIVVDGLRRTKASKGVEGYLLANRSLPWWAVGLSVMATQLSAITLVGTTGQAYADGMRLIQFYFGLPFAMVVLSVSRPTGLLFHVFSDRVSVGGSTAQRDEDVKRQIGQHRLGACVGCHAIH
jgi:Na+/pantothenate symporter